MASSRSWPVSPPLSGTSSARTGDATRHGDAASRHVAEAAAAGDERGHRLGGEGRANGPESASSDRKAPLHRPARRGLIRMIGCPCHGPAIGGSWPIFLPPVLLPFGSGFFFIHNIRPGAGYKTSSGPMDQRTPDTENTEVQGSSGSFLRCGHVPSRTHMSSSAAVRSRRPPPIGL